MLSTKKYCVYVCPAVTWSSLFTLKHSLIFEIQKSTIIKFGVHKWSKVNTTVQCCQNATMFKNNPVQFFRHSCILISQGTDATDKKYKVLENWAKRGDFLNQPTPHPCDRVCKKDESMICRYTFVLELHTSMGKVNV